MTARHAAGIIGGLAVAAVGCRSVPAVDPPPAASASASSAPSAAAAPASGAAPPSALLESPACNRTDAATVLLPRSPAETRALLDRLKVGPVAVRYRGCEVELLPTCSVAGSGEWKEVRGCCETSLGCAGDGDVECRGAEERRWFGDEREWALDLPELVRRGLPADTAALVTFATVRREYRAELGPRPEASCAEATHVIAGARFGAVRVLAESARTRERAPALHELFPASGTETLIDLRLAVVARADRGAGPPCMGLAGHAGSWAPARFRDETYVAPPVYCALECASGKTDCATACQDGVLAACDRRVLGERPALAARFDAACDAGFGQACARGPGVDPVRLTALCAHGGEGSARACADASALLPPEKALEPALAACERGRVGCDRAAELLRALRRDAEPAYERSLRFGCAGGDAKLCCTLGALEIDRRSNEAAGAKLLGEQCAESVQSCCTALRERGRPVPPRKRRPD